jgi:hypothetical protein
MVKSEPLLGDSLLLSCCSTTDGSWLAESPDSSDSTGIPSKHREGVSALSMVVRLPFYLNMCCKRQLLQSRQLAQRSQFSLLHVTRVHVFDLEW